MSGFGPMGFAHCRHCSDDERWKMGMIFEMDQRSEGWSSTANVRGQDHVSTDDCS